MCSICGILDFENKVWNKTVRKMNETMVHRGPDENGIFEGECVCFGHNRLSVIDPENGKQPMSAYYGNKKYTIVYNGEIYNCDELRHEIEKCGITLSTRCDTEIVLYSYILYGEDCAKFLNGIFAFAIWDGEKLFCARDRFGVKPFYYSFKGSEFIFASEIKAMLSHPKITSDVDKFGLWEILYLSPNFVSGKSVFRDILELNGGECITIEKNKVKKRTYWQIEATPYFKDRDYAIEKTRFLVSDAIKRQTKSDVPLCSLLSGGLDSSVVSAVASEEMRLDGKVLDTYSFEYEGNKESFSSTSFQPQCDDDFAILASKYLGTNHTVLTVPTDILAHELENATVYRDLVGQADIDSSLLYFCREIKKRHTVGLSGECSDEIFGGYPWFYRPEMLYSGFFPWIHQPRMRASLFKNDTAKSDTGFDYVREIYQNSLKKCPVLESDSDSMRLSRVGSYLSVNYFMTSLLQRKDRMSMASGVEVRVPFADHRIFEFVFNVPWEIKFEGGVEKALLRNAMSSYLPNEILWRKKSPYPKTHNPKYLETVLSMLKKRISSGGYLKENLNASSLFDALEKGGTWFGQLMGDAQLISWLIQFDIWVEKNGVNFV